MSQDQDLIDKYLADTPEMRDLLCYPDRDKLRSILTRLLSEYDAQRGVDGWQLRLADKLLADKQYIADMPITRESLAAVIARHAPKGVDVLAPILWAKLALGEFKTTNSNGEYTIVITEKKLAAALLAAQGEK